MNALSPPFPAMQRSHGEAVVTLVPGPGRARLRGLRQIGCAKAILPRCEGAVPEVVFLNTAGGLTSGDLLSYALTLGPGCRALATTQTAERAYAAPHGPARVTVRHAVGAGGWLDWLPQETILFQNANLHRQTRIDLAPGAGCLLLESLVLGRAAMGETVTRLHLTDRREITRVGRPLLLDPFALDGTILSRADSPALLGGARAMAVLALVGAGAEDSLAPVRAVLDEAGVEAAASAFDGRLLVRLLAADGWPLRRQVARLLGVLRRGALPRVWQM
ncbi:urease accessory protein UreD [Paracoccaceae bacterium Fryx2]|nr:urease accessory protein UreD [Paracoccaceae bacterium Fryx2]